MFLVANTEFVRLLAFRWATRFIYEPSEGKKANGMPEFQLKVYGTVDDFMASFSHGIHPAETLMDSMFP